MHKWIQHPVWNRKLSARLWYPHCYHTGDTTVLYWSLEMMCWCLVGSCLCLMQYVTICHQILLLIACGRCGLRGISPSWDMWKGYHSGENEKALFMLNSNIHLQLIQYPLLKFHLCNLTLMAYCKKDVTPLLTHWCYVFLALDMCC